METKTPDAPTTNGATRTDDEIRAALAVPFSALDLENRPQLPKNWKANKAYAVLTYVTNRAIMERLDDVFGVFGWKNDFAPGPDGGVVCRLSVWSDTRGGWITKSDGAERSQVQPIKGGLSGSMKRAAVHFGIGRYLYSVPSEYIKVDEGGRFVQQMFIPDEFLPESERGENNPTRGGVGDPAKRRNRGERRAVADGASEAYGGRSRDTRAPGAAPPPQNAQAAPKTGDKPISKVKVNELKRAFRMNGWNAGGFALLLSQYGAADIGEIKVSDYEIVLSSASDKQFATDYNHEAAEREAKK